MKNLLRNLAYASLLMASLTATVHYLNLPALANTASLGNIVAVEGYYTLLSDGRLFQFTRTGWHEASRSPIPIPVSQVAFFADASGEPQIVDTSGNGWASSEFDGWTNVGPPPGFGPTAVTPSTWSSIKGQFAPRTGGGR